MNANGNWTTDMPDKDFWEWRAAANAWQADKYREPGYTQLFGTRLMREIKDYQDTVVYCLLRAAQSK